MNGWNVVGSYDYCATGFSSFAGAFSFTFHFGRQGNNNVSALALLANARHPKKTIAAGQPLPQRVSHEKKIRTFNIM